MWKRGTMKSIIINMNENEVVHKLSKMFYIFI